MSFPVQSQRDPLDAAVKRLPDRWVERIWTEMRSNYGAEFDRLWACPEGVEAVKHVEAMRLHWSGNLAVFAGNPSAIRYALDNLPTRCPSLPEFAALCRRRPDAPVLALEGPPADPARVAEALAKAKAPTVPRHRMAWALAVREREARGDRVGLFARAAWREALRLPPDAPARQQGGAA